MLKKSIILLVSLLLLPSCTSTNSKITKKESIKTNKLENKQIYKKYYDENTALYSIDNKVVKIKDLKKKYPEYSKIVDESFSEKRAKFLRKEILNYVKENNITNYKILLPLKRVSIIENEKQTKGDKSAPYTLVVFSDFQCPYCSKYAKEFDREVMKNKDFKIVFKNFPLSFHKNAKDAAIASICAANQGRFWEFHDKLFKNQNELSDSLYMTIAQELKLDQAKFMECLTNEETKNILLKQMEEGKKLGVRGTPTYFLNDVAYNDTRNIKEFNKIYKNYKKSDKDIKYSDLENLNTVILYLNKKPYTIKDFYKLVPELAIKFNNKVANEAYNMLKKITETDVVNVIFTKEAKENKFENPENYMAALIKKEIKEPTAEEVKTLYEAYKNRLRGATFDQVKEQLKQFIMKSKVDGFFRKKNLELIKKYNVNPLLLPPKFTINYKNSPIIGNKDAINTIFVFSDFQCPYCSRVAPIIEKLAKEKNIKIVYKFFPLSFHKRAFPAALASYCAYKQNKFWEFHDKAFKNQYQLTENNFLKWAQELKLNIDKFKECATDKESSKTIKKEIEEGISIGVQGTPSLYINGMIYEDDPSNLDKINEFINKIK